MNEIKIFENPEFGKVRTLEINGEPWFVGKDVAEILGYSNPRDALAKHVDGEDKNTVAICDGNKGNPNLTVINESGLYSLILSSKLPKAKEFKHWVTSEVLPSIRKTGSYSLPEMTPMEMIAQLAQNAVKVERTLDEHGKRIDKLEEKSETDTKALVYEALTYGTLTFEQQKFIQAKIALRVCQLLPEYSDYKEMHDKVTNSIYNDLRKRYGVSSFRNIRVRCFKDAISFIDNYNLKSK